jgi:hypothetical protein
MLSEIHKSEPDDVNIGEAAWDVIEAGQRVLLARIDMLVLEARQAALSAQRQAVMCLLAVVLLATAWIAFNFTAVLAMREYVSWVVAGGVTTGLNALLGGALLFRAWR